MGVFNNQNTFYNSTWHQYGLPVSRQQLQPIKLEVPKIQFPSYVQQWRQFRNNPFGIDSTLLPPPDNTYEPFPINPFSYTNYDPYAGQYDDIYYDGDFRNPVSNQTINNVRMGLNGVTQAINALGQGRTTGAGEKDANYYINAASKLGSNLPGEAGLFFSGINAASSLLNALAGSQLDQKNIKAFESAIQNRARWQMGDNSTTSALVGSSANNVDLKVPGVKYFGRNPLLSDILGYGVGKASGKAWSMKQPTAQANAQAHNTEALGYKDYQNKYIRNGLLAGSYALGGAINRFDNGGGINTPRTHGSLFNTGLTEINAGGRHSENQFGGVQFGVDQYGIPNLVEEGETVFNAQSYGGPQDYAFSDEIEFPIKEYGHLFSLGGMTKRKKGKYKKYTFADVSKYLAEDVKQNPNSDIVKRTFAENAGKLANIQEEVKAKDMINQMNPMDIMMALQQSPMGEQMVSDTQGSMDQQAMMGQEPMIAACGGKLFSNGGNMFGPVNLFAKAGGIKTRRRTNNTLTVNGQEVYELPETMVLHDPLFRTAISELIKDRKSTYDKLVQEKKYSEAYDLVKNLQSDISGVQIGYYQAMLNPTSDNISALQERFNNLGLNKNVNTVLSEKVKDKKGKDVYPVYQKGKPFLSDNPLDSVNGVVTQNRYIDFDNYDKALLREMGLNISDLQTAINNYGVDTWNSEFPTLNYSSNTPDYLKSLAMLSVGDLNTDKVILNPAYAKDNTQPQYMNLDDYIRLYETPEGEDSATWWDNLADVDKQKIYAKYGTVGDLTRTGVYTQQQIYGLTEAAKKAQQEASKATGTTAAANDNKNRLLVPKPRNDWETMGSLGVALSDYIKSQFNIGMGERNPGAEAAYNYLSRVGMIPMVRNHMVGTKHEYRPTDKNYRENIESNITRGDIRMLPNVNYGNSLTNFFALMNQANKKRAEAQVLADETDRKERGFIYGNNNEVDKTNAQGSLNAQTVNAQNLARAREAQATAAIQLANTLSGNNKTWLDYQNQQSSGLADLLYKLGYNKQMFNARDAAWLAKNQQPDTATVGGIQFDIYDDYNDFLKNKIG